MVFPNFKQTSIVVVIAFTLSACSDPPDMQSSKLTYRGENYQDNVLIIRSGRGYFGDETIIPRNLGKLYTNNDNCIDLGLIAFSLNSNTIKCGNFKFSFNKSEDGKIFAKGNCAKTETGKCYADIAAPTTVEYILTKSEMPQSFRFHVQNMFNDNFVLVESE